MPRLRTGLAAAALTVAVVLVGCSDDDGGGAEGRSDAAAVQLRDDLDAAVERAYEDVSDSVDDIDTTCFVLDDDAVDRVSAALGLDSSAAVGDRARLSGRAGSSSLACSYTTATTPGSADPQPVSILVDRTDRSLDDLVERVTSDDEAARRLEGSSEGLDPSSVAGLAQDGFQQVIWSQDGLWIAVGAPEEDVSVDGLFRALPVLVEEIGRVVAAEPAG